MPKFKFAKLVRDKIVEHQEASGAKPHFRQLTASEHKQELVNKIAEEAHEITQAGPDEIAAEIADVQQAIDGLKELYGVSDADVAKAQDAKNQKNGAFKKGLYVDYVEVREGRLLPEKCRPLSGDTVTHFTKPRAPLEAALSRKMVITFLRNPLSATSFATLSASISSAASISAYLCGR